VGSSGNAREGVGLAKSERPHAIPLDLLLPDINGYQVCEERRRHDFRDGVAAGRSRGRSGDRSWLAVGLHKHDEVGTSIV
jgi:CheY-like chemotaxis protein